MLLTSPQMPVVLLVDDHEDSLAMYSFGLMAMGFEVATARSADDAIGLARVLRPDVVVLDVWLPVRSGLELTEALRSDTQTAGIVIVALTGDAGARADAHRAGADRFLLKPCSAEVLAHEIRDMVAQRPAGRRPATATRPPRVPWVSPMAEPVDHTHR